MVTSDPNADMHGYCKFLQAKYKLGECAIAAREFAEHFPNENLDICMFNANGESRHFEMISVCFIDLPGCMHHVFIWHTDTEEITDPIFGIFRMHPIEYGLFMVTKMAFEAPYDYNLILELQRSTLEQAIKNRMCIRKYKCDSGIRDVFHIKVPVPQKD